MASGPSHRVYAQNGELIAFKGYWELSSFQVKWLGLSFLRGGIHHLFVIIQG